MSSLTAHQLAVIRATRSNLLSKTPLIVGGAGTGKSRTAMHLVAELAKNMSCKIIVACAAAAPLDKYRMRFSAPKYQHVLVMTLHSLVGIKPTQHATGIVSTQFREAVKRGAARFGPVPSTKSVILVIEEVFAATSELINQAQQSLAVLPHSGKSSDNVHLILVGCPHQMSQVGGTCALQADVFRDDARPVLRLVLTENKRCRDADASFLRLLHVLRYWMVLGESALREADAELYGLSMRGLPKGDDWVESVKLTATNAHAMQLNSQEAALRYRRQEGTMVFMAYVGSLALPESTREPNSKHHTVLWLGKAVVIYPGGVDAVAIDDDNDVAKIPNSAQIEITQLSNSQGVRLADRRVNSHLCIRCDDVAVAMVFVKYAGKEYRIDAMHITDRDTKQPLHFLPVSMMGAITINRAQGQDIPGKVCIMMQGVRAENLIDHVYTGLTRCTSMNSAYLSGYEPGSIIQAGKAIKADASLAMQTFRNAVRSIDRVELAQIKKATEERPAKRQRTGAT